MLRLALHFNVKSIKVINECEKANAGKSPLHPVSASGVPGAEPGQIDAPQKEKHGHERETEDPDRG